MVSSDVRLREVVQAKLKYRTAVTHCEERERYFFVPFSGFLQFNRLRSALLTL